MAEDDDDLEFDVDQVEGSRAGRVAFARIEALTLHAVADPLEAIAGALVPGTTIDRHNRVWHMGQVRSEGNSLVGRIGFETANLTELWDEEAKDFREDTLPAGTTSPFAIDPSAMRVAFQLRSGLIRVKSFTGALQGLMNAASPDDRWRVHQELEEVPFEAWAKTVERIVSLHIRIERPNPHYGDRKRVKELVEGANARMAELAWRADPEALDGLDVNDPFIREAIAHSEHYGAYSATGERQGEATRWVSEHEAAAELRELEADPVTREVAPASLRRELGDVESPEPPGSEEAGEQT